MRRILKVPLDLSRIDVDCDNAVAVEVVALARLARPLGARLPGPVEDDVLFGIVAAADPHGAAAKLERITGPRLAARIAGLLRNHIPRPVVLAGFRVERLNEPAWLIAAHDHFALRNERRLSRQP